VVSASSFQDMKAFELSWRRALGLLCAACAMLAPIPASTDVVTCPKDSGRLLEEIADQTVPFEGSHLVPESHVESTNSPIVSLYSYCIRNRHAYTSAFARWHYEGDRNFIDTRPVPAQGERYENHRMLSEKYAGKHDVAYGLYANRLDDSRKVDTLAWQAGQEGQNTNETLNDPDEVRKHIHEFGSLSLGTKSVVDFPLTQKVGKALLSGEYSRYSAEDFVTMTVAFSSDAIWKDEMSLSYRLDYNFEEEGDAKLFFENGRIAFALVKPGRAGLPLPDDLPRADQGIPILAQSMREAGMTEIPDAGQAAEITAFPSGTWFEHTVYRRDASALRQDEGKIIFVDEAGNHITSVFIPYWVYP
jgi:hypothetical protein